MSIIPTIFRKQPAAYSVVGGLRPDRIRKHSCDLTIVILNRGGRFFREDLFRVLEKRDYPEIISIEGPNIPYDIEPLTREFSRVRFLLLQQEASIGEKINLGIEEARSKHILVAWSDMEPPEIQSELLEQVTLRHRLCTVPKLELGGKLIPSIQNPAMIRGTFKSIPWDPVQPEMPSLYPFDYCGLYLREKFRHCGGFDPWIQTLYWQKLDFGLRAHLWGEEIRYEQKFHLQYSAPLDAEDSTPDEGYKLFYLKNLAVRFTGDMGVLPRSKFLRYALRSDSGFFYAWKEFRAVHRWVTLNRYRFKTDVSGLLDQWEIPS